jgi:hypothetical protein
MAFLKAPVVTVNPNIKIGDDRLKNFRHYLS